MERENIYKIPRAILLRGDGSYQDSNGLSQGTLPSRVKYCGRSVTDKENAREDRECFPAISMETVSEGVDNPSSSADKRARDWVRSPGLLLISVDDVGDSQRSGVRVISGFQIRFEEKQVSEYSGFGSSCGAQFNLPTPTPNIPRQPMKLMELLIEDDRNVDRHLTPKNVSVTFAEPRTAPVNWTIPVPEEISTVWDRCLVRVVGGFRVAEISVLGGLAVVTRPIS
ncbi:uncharacterized protein B0H64DRAFT_373112 [Chaetomium fimeti]|uniref:Uncharacterized protein n=1 Tax=Chaetomium fimeti TaxID=1854472 RepID=A0AAE0HJT0_9PEZI|nr:hypothetical protein B0H64DRAFT_373112 [Chaetomium fimeti]